MLRSILHFSIWLARRSLPPGHLFFIASTGWTARPGSAGRVLHFPCHVAAGRYDSSPNWKGRFKPTSSKC